MPDNCTEGQKKARPARLTEGRIGQPSGDLVRHPGADELLVIRLLVIRNDQRGMRQDVAVHRL